MLIEFSSQNCLYSSNKLEGILSENILSFAGINFFILYIIKLYIRFDMNDYILYILPFKNGNHFKFGITKIQSLKRIKQINSLYDIDIDNGFIYRGDKTSVISAESELKIYETLEVDEYLGLPGYTEIRDISKLDMTINIISKYNLLKEPLKVYEEMCVVKTIRLPSRNNIKSSGSDLSELPNDIFNTSSDIFDIPYHLTKR